MHDMAARYRAAQKKGWLRSRSILEACQIPLDDEVTELEARIGCSLPLDMKAWLGLVGFCTFGDELSFRSVWFSRVEQGHLAGSVCFAQDDLGNFFGFVPSTGEVVFFSRSESAYATLAPSFRAFLEQLESRGYKLGEWVESLTLSPYEWKAA